MIVIWKVNPSNDGKDILRILEVNSLNGVSKSSEYGRSTNLNNKGNDRSLGSGRMTCSVVASRSGYGRSTHLNILRRNQLILGGNWKVVVRVSGVNPEDMGDQPIKDYKRVCWSSGYGGRPGKWSQIIRIWKVYWFYGGHKILWILPVDP